MSGAERPGGGCAHHERHRGEIRSHLRARLSQCGGAVTLLAEGGWIQMRTLTSPLANSPNTMPTFSDPSIATNHTASSACTRPTAARISSSRSPAGAPDPSPAARTSSVRAAKMSRSASAENGRSTRLSPGCGLPLPRGETQLVVEVFEFVANSASRNLGQPVEGQPKHRLATGGRRAEHGCDRLDGRVVVLGLHDDVEELMPPFERADQRVGDLSAFGSSARRRSWREA